MERMVQSYAMQCSTFICFMFTLMVIAMVKASRLLAWKLTMPDGCLLVVKILHGILLDE